MLRLPSSWTWDFWLADDGRQYHLFFLKAPRSLVDPDRRHWRASIGHAVSTDLREWTPVDDALLPAPTPAWDDLATWTGSVTRGPDDRWYMHYTGVSRADNGLRQRIGTAVSDDLHVWRRTRFDPLEADPRWYERLTDGGWPDEAWRDPWVVADPGGDGWHMLTTARSKEGGPDQRGVIGHAVSDDLLHWTVQPPLSSPGAGFGQLEVPQVAAVGGQYVLIFSCLGKDMSREARAAGAVGGVWLADGRHLLGPWDISAARRLTDESLYAGRLVQDRDGTWHLLAFKHNDQNGGFVGELSEPLPVATDADARLVLAPPDQHPHQHAVATEEAHQHARRFPSTR